MHFILGCYNYVTNQSFHRNVLSYSVVKNIVVQDTAPDANLMYSYKNELTNTNKKLCT